MVKAINSEYALEGLMLKLKPQCFGCLKQRANSLEKPLVLEKIEGKRRRGQQRMMWLDSITNSMDINLIPTPQDSEDKEVGCAAVYGGHKEKGMT